MIKQNKTYQKFTKAASVILLLLITCMPGQTQKSLLNTTYQGMFNITLADDIRSVKRFVEDAELTEQSDRFMDQVNCMVQYRTNLDTLCFWSEVYEREEYTFAHPVSSNDEQQRRYDPFMAGVFLDVIYKPVPGWTEDAPGYTGEIKVNYLNLELSPEHKEKVATVFNQGLDIRRAKPEQTIFNETIRAGLDTLQRILAEYKLPRGSLWSPTVTFTQPKNKTTYGYDHFRYQAHKGTGLYEQYTLDGKHYEMPWFSVPTGRPAVIQAQVSTPDSTFNTDTILFRTSLGITIIPEPSPEDSILYLTVQGRTHEQEQVIEAYMPYVDSAGTQQEKIIGQCKVITYNSTAHNLVVVPLNDATAPTGSVLEDRLNDIYKTSATEWVVNIDDPLNIPRTEWDTDDDGALNYEAFGRKYCDEMRSIYNYYKDKRSIDKNNYYLFLVPEPLKDDYVAYMPLKGQFAFISTGEVTQDELPHTLAHELGHGSFRLYHTFSDKNDYPVARGTTDNLMDYNNGSNLHKYQWDAIHDPQKIIAWLQGEEEGAYYNATLADTWIRNLNDIACGINQGNATVELNIACKKDSRANNRVNTNFTYRDIPVQIVAASLPADGMHNFSLSNYTTDNSTRFIFKSSSDANKKIEAIVSSSDFGELKGYLEQAGTGYFERLVSDIPSEESKDAYAALTQLPVCSYKGIDITDRIKYFEWLSGELWTNTDQEVIILDLLTHVKDRKELFDELYKRPVLVAKLMLSCDGDNRQNFINEITKLCDESWISGVAAKGDVYIGTVPSSFGTFYSGNDFITYAVLSEGSTSCSVRNYIGRFPKGMFDWGNVQKLRQLTEFDCNLLDPVEIISSDGSQGLFPLIYPVNLSQQHGNQQVGQQFAATLNYIGVASSVRILATGSKLAKSIAFVELTKTGLDAIFNDPQVIQTLNQTEDGKKFLKYWQIASVTIDIATIGVDVLENIAKHGPEASKALRAAGKNDAADNVDDLVAEARALNKVHTDEITDLLKRFDDLSDAEIKVLFNKLSKTEIKYSSKITKTQADILQEIESRGITNPYNFAHDIEDITLSQEALFVRVHNANNPNRPWLIAIEDFKEFTSTDDIVKKLALPVVGDGGALTTPTKLSFAKLPVGTKIRKSVARPQDWPGYGHLPGGAVQFEIIENSNIPRSWFTPIDDLSNYYK